jgi:ADP-L-glycero-D-manno-heptose 6-epimerase
MIVLTGAAGFIGSNILEGLNLRNYKDIVLVDDFSREEKRVNYEGKQYRELVDRADLDRWIHINHRFVQIVIHMGARTDTSEFDWDTFLDLNLNYSKRVWALCVEFGLPMIYASSAATYGMGELGYEDEHELSSDLKPLNPYGKSKNEFDKWVLAQEKQAFFWAGLKFFNVYGPNEQHKGRMSSVVYQAYHQIKATGKMKLFRSHHPDYVNGGQRRDFIYVKDIVEVILFLMEQRPESGIYNLGTGNAATFNELVNATFSAMEIPSVIEFIDTPEDIRDKYQYFTEAKMDKLRSIGYDRTFRSIEEGVEDYVRKYLS